MKARHIESLKDYAVGDVLGGSVTLHSLSTGQRRKVDYSQFKNSYELIEDNEANYEMSLNEKKELDEARLRAEEIISEAQARSDQIVHIDFEPKKVKKERVKKVKSVGGTKLKDICEELKVDQRVARRKLRSAKVEKPSSGWEWSDPSEVAKIKSLLK